MARARSDPLRLDLRVQPCLNALTKSGARRPISLLEAFDDAEDIVAIIGSTPGETISVIEFLLAIMYAAGQAPPSVSAWLTAVEDGVPLSGTSAWLRAQSAEDWDLFHPERPFGQNALLAPYLGEHGVGFAQLVPERAGDYNQFFDHVHLHFPEPIPADAAFRSILAQHTYGLPGRAMVKNELLGRQLTYLATGRLAGRIRVLARGRTLADVLRMNIAPARDAGTFNTTWTDGRARRNFRSEKNPYTPDGPADLHSFLGRSILLHPVATPSGAIGVDRVLIGAGELLEPDLPDAFRQDEVLVERNGKLVTLAPNPDTAMWRQANALYAATVDREKGGDLFNRLARLTNKHDHQLDLWAVGVVFNKTVALTWMDDVFPFTPGRHTDLRWAADEGMGICDYAVKCLYAAANRAREIVYPAEKPADKISHTTRFNAAPDFWAGAGVPFHRLLDRVNAATSPEAALNEFGAATRLLADQSLDHRLASLPRTSQGLRARARAREALHDMMRGSKAPYYFMPPKDRR